MKKLVFTVLCLLINANAIEIAVIVNKNLKIKKLSVNELRDIYLKKKSFINNKKVIPINLKKSSKIRKLFQKKVIKMDDEELSLYWNEMYFYGTKPPIVFNSEKAVIKFVEKFKNAIGYVNYEKVKNLKNIRIVNIIKVENNGE